MALQAPVTNHQTSVKQADEEVSTTGGLQHVSLPPPPPPPPPLSVSSGFSSCFSVAYSRFCVDLEFFGNMLGIFDMGQGREGGREGGRGWHWRLSLKCDVNDGSLSADKKETQSIQVHAAQLRPPDAAPSPASSCFPP